MAVSLDRWDRSFRFTGRVPPLSRVLRNRLRRLRSEFKHKRQSPLALATELSNLKQDSDLPWRSIDHHIGVSPTHRKLLLSLLSLPMDMAGSIGFGVPTRKCPETGFLGLKHARSLFLLRDRPDLQRTLYSQLRQQNMGANKTLRSVLARRKGNTLAGNDREQDPNIQAALDRLRHKFGTKVELRPRPTGGEFILEFYNDDDMLRLYDLLSQ